MKWLQPIILIPFTAVYLIISFQSPMDPVTIARYHLSYWQAVLVNLSLIIPLIIIWFAVLSTANAFKQYSLQIRKHPDGEAFVMLATGIQVLALYFPARTITHVILNHVTLMHPALAPYANAAIIYISIAFRLIGFLFVIGAVRKLELIGKVQPSHKALHLIGLGFICLCVLYCYVAFNTSGHTSSTNWLITSLGFLPLPVRITTVVIPNLYIWLIGLFSLYQMHLYAIQVQGLLYRRAISRLITGLSGVIASLMIQQFITAFAPYLTNLSLWHTMILSYLFVLLFGAAFYEISLGVKRFKMLESPKKIRL